MKTQHIKFEILKKDCVYSIATLYNIMFSTGQICKENFHPFSDVMDDITQSLDACHR